MDEVEFFAVVFEVASNAIFAVWIAHLKLGVIAEFGGEGMSDFLVALKTFEGGSAGAELVAGGTLRGA